MANLQLYVVAYVTVNGSLLCEEASVDVKRTTGSQPVKTVAKGYAGESPGAAMVEIQVSNAVPAADFELDPGQAMALLKVTEIGVVGPGGKILKANGFIVEDNFKHAVDQESSLSFTFRGQMPQWQ